MKDQARTRPVERLFPFVLRARILLIGREVLARSKSKLHFVLVTEDLSPGSKEKMLQEFAHYPVIQRYTSADLEKHFGVHGAKVLGFSKSTLAQSIYSELKQYRINSKPEPDTRAGSSPPRERSRGTQAPTS